METYLGFQLFCRKPRGVELTESARFLFEEARAVLQRLEQAEREARRVARGEQGQLRIGVAHTAPFHPLVPGVVRAFRDALPGVTVILEECLSRQAVQGLTEARLDAAFVRAELPADAGLAVHPLLDEPMMAAVPAAHPLAAAATPLPPPRHRCRCATSPWRPSSPSRGRMAQACSTRPSAHASEPDSRRDWARRRRGSPRHWAWLPLVSASPSFLPPCTACTWTASPIASWRRLTGRRCRSGLRRDASRGRRHRATSWLSSAALSSHPTSFRPPHRAAHDPVPSEATCFARPVQLPSAPTCRFISERFPA